MVRRNTEAAALIRMPAVSGGTRTILNEQQIMCPEAITMDYQNINVYWNFACRRQIHMIRIDGTKHDRLDDGNIMIVTGTHSHGIAYYNGVVYWTDGERIIRFNATTSRSDIFYKGYADGIRVVHSSLQPTGISIPVCYCT